MRDLLVWCCEPHDVRAREHGVEEHHTLEGGSDGGRSAEPTIGFADGFVQLPMAYMIDARAIVRAVVRGRVIPLHELGEEHPRLLAEDDAGERRVLAHETDAGVTHDEDQEPRLTLGEPLLTID